MACNCRVMTFGLLAFIRLTLKRNIPGWSSVWFCLSAAAKSLLNKKADGVKVSHPLSREWRPEGLLPWSGLSALGMGILTLIDTEYLWPHHSGTVTSTSGQWFVMSARFDLSHGGEKKDSVCVILEVNPKCSFTSWYPLFPCSYPPSLFLTKG